MDTTTTTSTTTTTLITTSSSFYLFLYFGISSLTIASFTIIFNGLNLYAFFRERGLRSNPSNNLIIALTVSDLSYGLYNFVFLGIPYAIFQDGYPYGEYGCMVAGFTQNFFVVSNLLLLAITIDKVLLVALDISQYRWLQTRFVEIAIGVCFFAGLLIGATELAIWRFATKREHIAKVINFEQYCLYPSRRLWEFGLLFSLGFYAVPILSILCLSVVFLGLLCRRIKRRSPSQSSIYAVSKSAGGSQGDISGPETFVRTRNFYVKPAVTLGVLVGAMAFTGIPYSTYLIVAGFCDSCNSQTLLRVFVLMSELNALLDPVFYALTQRKLTDFYRQKIKRHLGCLRG